MSITILIVDDEEHTRINLEALVKEKGYSTITAATYAEAKEQVGKGNCDLVLMDMQLPDGYGPNLLIEMANLPYHPPVIMLDEDAQAGGLAQELAFESADYAQVREVEEGKPGLLLEADYALGDGNEIGIWLDDMSAESKALADPMVSKMGPTGMARRILLTPAAVKITRLRCSRPHSQRTLIPRVLSSARLATVVTLPAAVKRIPLR